MVDNAHKLTDDKLEQMERHLSAIYSRAGEDLRRKNDEYFAKFKILDAKKRKLVDAGELDEAEYKRWRKNKILYSHRFADLQEQLAAELLHTNETAVAYINDQLPEIYALNYNALEDTVDGLGGYSFTLVDPQTVRHLATTDSSLLPFKEIDPEKDILWNMKKINTEVLQGIIQGESIPKIAARIGNVEAMNEHAAVRTARTIVTEAENKGRLDSYEKAQSDGIILQKEWISSDQPGRTRDWHMPGAFENLIVDIDKPFVNGIGPIRFPGDHTAHGANVYNCRCTMGAVVKGFKNNKTNNEYKNIGQKDLKSLHEKMNISKESEEIIKSGYIGGAKSFEINDAFRRHDNALDHLTDEELLVSKTLDKAISENPLRENAILHRVADEKWISSIIDVDEQDMNWYISELRRGNLTEEAMQAFDFLKGGMVGRTVKEKAYMSTSADINANVFRGRGIHINIKAPKGTPAYVTENYKESEIILGRNTKYEIQDLKIEEYKEKKDRKAYEIVMDVLIGGKNE